MAASIDQTIQHTQINLWGLLSPNNMKSGKHVPEMYTPFEPHFYVEKMEFAGVYLFVLVLFQSIDNGYLLEPPRAAHRLPFILRIYYSEAALSPKENEYSSTKLSPYC